MACKTVKWGVTWQEEGEEPRGSPGGGWCGRSARASSEKPCGKITLKREGNAGRGGMAARSSVIIRC